MDWTDAAQREYERRVLIRIPQPESPNRTASYPGPGAQAFRTIGCPYVETRKLARGSTVRNLELYII